MTPPNDKDQPLGKRIRDIINPLLENEDTHKIMAELVDDYLISVAMELPGHLQSSMRTAFAAAALKNPGERQMTLIEGILFYEDGQTKIPMVQRLPLKICPDFLELPAKTVRNMQGYIMLHQVARDLDVSINVTGLTIDEKISSSHPQQPSITIDLTKSYKDGIANFPFLVPDLPEEKGRKESGDRKFSFDL